MIISALRFSVVIFGNILETDEERAEWEAGKRRSELRKQRKAEQF